ncbi:methyltransferase domain-containing protein [uncultured Desulfosarcina sp.]|uniref:class I SAM-dependent methyltransferase n=1 Tax=uncultured Desulfosarcina sp. TaxID=218289 RepID=UPI0029C8E7F1|nr:methyltransferase domain-containing protein [uncultured Desulfosarcina sp.]
MDVIDLNSVADIVFQLKWDSKHAAHNECYAARGVNLWRDWLPDTVRQSLIGKRPFEQAAVGFSPGELFGNDGGQLTIDRRQFSRDPKAGRFYPKGCLSDLPGVFPQNMQPFRCVGVNNGHMVVNIAHPLSDHPLSLSMTVGQVSAKESERGGSSVDWVGLLTEGPGMQARWQGKPTDFFSDMPFARRDEQPDNRFYGNPRLVHHLDETARYMVADLYKRFVKDGMKVLDLMSSWVSHLPEGVEPAGVSGLGMNRTELEQNPRLTDVHVHDLNVSPVLPYDNESFDIAICSVSVEYLTRPFEVFADVGRVLKPGGTFVVTFTNRWFPPKVVRIWEQIHEFERVGLVMEYFLKSGSFDNLGTYSMRGLPRPRKDKYAGDLALSDPVYAVWGTKTARRYQ